MKSLRIRTPSRLHFGLLGWGKEAARQFGGVGLMIEDPGIELSVREAANPAADGPLAARIQKLLAELPDRFREMSLPSPEKSARILVRQAPGEHAGLGVGTQLSLAVTRALLELNGFDPKLLNPSTLARLSGRGIRSGIGIHGFFAGGLIVDGGRRSESEVPPLLVRHPFPVDWLILIIQPPLLGLHGAAERRAFAELPPVPERITERLCRLVLLDLLPGLVEHNLAGFGQALSELQRRVGECFSPVQGGLFASNLSAEIVGELGRLKLEGAGQSSWGPTLYAFSQASRDERTDMARRIRDRFGLPHDSVFWTRGANRGATVESISDASQAKA